MSEEVILGIDQGSSSTKAVLYSPSKGVLFESALPVSRSVYADGRVEQDPEEILGSVASSIRTCRKFAIEHNLFISSAGLSVQRSGVTAWRRADGSACYPLMTWADLSTKPLLDARPTGESIVRAKTSLPFLAHYAAGKYSLLHAKFPSDDIAVGTLDTFLMNRLCVERPFITEDSMASRTMLYDLRAGEWDEELCALFPVTRIRLPAVRATCDMHGTIDGIPLRASVGDQQAALVALGEGNYDGNLNLGTIASLTVLVTGAEERVNGFLTNVLFSRSGAEGRERRWFLEGTTNACGAGIAYLRDRLGTVPSLTALNQLVSPLLDDPALPVLYAPAGGTATPHWRYDVDAVIEEGEWTKDVISAAMVENIAFFIARNISLLKESGYLPKYPTLRVSGGVCEVESLLQRISAAAGVELVQCSSRESSAVGAALLAGGEVFAKHQARALEQRRSVMSEKDVSARFHRWLDLEKEALRGGNERCSYERLTPWP